MNDVWLSAILYQLTINGSTQQELCFNKSFKKIVPFQQS